MPKNNSKTRKQERKNKALARHESGTVRKCGHFHTDNGSKFCGLVVLRNEDSR